MNTGLEAAAILLYIMTSPGIDRRVVNEDAIVASMVLMKHNLGKNILPAINDCGHIFGAAAKATTAEERLASPGHPTKKRRRSRASVSTTEASTMKDMKKAYATIYPTIGHTVVLMERLDTLIQTIPLDDQHLMTCSAAALQSLELDPSVVGTIQMSHSLHVATTCLVTSIFRKYPKVRGMIIEDLFPLMLRMPTGKKSLRTFPVQCSSVLYPHGITQLSKSLLGSSSSSSTAGTPSYQHQEASNIQPLSVLILSFVQSSVMKPAFKINGNASGGDDTVLQGEEEPFSAVTMALAAGNFDDDISATNVPRVTSGLGGCQVVSNMIVKRLMDRCSKKGEDGGASEFRPILSNLIEDLLLILLVPEYPAAEMILLSIVNAISTDIVTRTSNKSWKDAETTYLNTIFDALGKICAAEARIRKWNEEHPVRDVPTVHAADERHFDCYCERQELGNKFTFNCDRCKSLYHGACVGMSRDRVPSVWLCDGCQLGRIVDFEKDRNANLGDLGTPAELIDRPYCMRRLLIDYLSIVSQKSDLDNVGVQDAYGFHLARWLNELDMANAEAAKVAAKSGRATGSLINNRKNVSLMSGLIEMWDPKDSQHLLGPPSGVSESLNGMLHCLSDEGRSRMVVDLLCKLSSLLMSFQTQIRFVVNLMDSGSKTIRKLSLKTIEKVADADSQLMLYSFIRKAVISRFSDESISVREAAVSLVGSYVVHSPGAANAFHAAFMVGLNDSGVSVRKRTILVLQDILGSNPGYNGRAEACSAMLRLAANPKEDDSARDLVHDLFSRLWLEDGDAQIEAPVDVSPESDHNGRGDQTMTPASKVSNVEVVDATTPAETPASNNMEMDTPARWSTATKSTRSTAKQAKNKRLHIRFEVAAQQMVEVVKVANTAMDLTSMFRELFSEVPDANKSRRSSLRKKRQGLAQGQCNGLVDALFEMLLSVEETEGLSADERGKDLVAIVRTIQVFTDVSPVDAMNHLDTMLPYFKASNGLCIDHETEIASALCGILSQIVPGMDKNDLENLAENETTLAVDLAEIPKKLGRNATASAVQALCLLAGHPEAPKPNVFANKLVELARTFYLYLLKQKDNDALKRKARENVKRALGVMGSICQFCESSSFPSEEVDGDSDLESIDDGEPSSREISLVNVAPVCEKIFDKYLSMMDTQIRCTALRALTGIFIAHPREMLRMDQSGMIDSVMARTAPKELQQMALRCWRDILLAEESRVESGDAQAKMDAKKDITMSKKISGDQDADATLFGGILTNHVDRLFTMTHSRDVGIRSAAVELVGHLLRQGQVNPNDSVPFLLALQGDLEEGIRSYALKLLMQEGGKRPDMLRQRLRAGIKRAFFFQKTVYPDKDEVTALIAVKREGVSQKECVFGSVYKECIATIKKQRRALFRDLVHFFDPQTLERGEGKAAFGKTKQGNGSSSTSLPDLALLSYTSQVLAYLPYSFQSDPLYIVHTVDSIISVQGPELVDKLASFLRPYGLVSDDELDDVLEDEDVIEEAAKRNVPHHAKEVTAMLQPSFDNVKFMELCMQAGCLILLLRLKAHLRKAYNLNEARCRNFNPQEKNVREMPVTRAPVGTDFFSQLALQNAGESTSVDMMDAMIFQYAEFRTLMRSEIGSDDSGNDAEDSDGMDMDDNDGQTAGSKKRLRASSASRVNRAIVFQDD